ncbi:MAG: ribose-phosphate pyrophosphokinase [Planctomycetota bacterium]
MMASRDDSLVIFNGSGTPDLAHSICADLNVAPGDAVVSRFPDGEVQVSIREDVRGKDVFIIQSTCPPVNENLMELLVLIDCVKRASADRITAVVPYFGYARQDRRDSDDLVPITAKLTANLIVAAGAHRVATMDLHTEQIQGFFDIPVDHLYGGAVFIDYLREQNMQDLVVCSPDVGSIKMARAYSKGLGARLATIDKRRISAEETTIGFVIGDVEGKNVLISDDVIATGGSIAMAADILKQSGAEDVYVACTHPVLCGPAVEKLEAAPIEQIFVTDTIPIDNKYKRDNITVLSTANTFANAIRSIHCTGNFRR